MWREWNYNKWNKRKISDKVKDNWREGHGGTADGHDLLVSEEIADNNRLQPFIYKKATKALRNIMSYNVIKPEDKLKK